MVVSAASDHRWQFPGAVSNCKRLIDAWSAHWGQRFNFLLGQLDLVVNMRRVTKRREIENSRDGDAGCDFGMIQYERREMAASRPTGHNNWALNSRLGALRIQPVKRSSNLIGDLGQTRLRSECVSGQGGGPATCQRTFSEEGKNFLAVALPISTVNVNETRCLGIVGGIKVPLRALS